MRQGKIRFSSTHEGAHLHVDSELLYYKCHVVFQPTALIEDRLGSKFNSDLFRADRLLSRLPVIRFLTGVQLL